MEFKNFPQPVVNENVDWTVREITNVIKRYGPREAGGENCFSTQKHLKKEMDTFSDASDFQEYQLAPRGEFNFTKIAPIIAILFVVAGLVVFFAMSNFMIANCLFLAGSVVALLLCVLKQPKGKKVTAHNFYAKRKPIGEIKKRVIVQGHCDASYEWVTNKAIIPFGIIVLAVNSISSAFMIANSSLKIVEIENLDKYMLSLPILTLFVMISMMLFINFKAVSAGANTSLTGTYAAVGAIRMLDMAGVDLENTELVALITDSSNGLDEFVKNNSDNLETMIISMDNLADAGNICVSGNSGLKSIALDASKNAGIDVKAGNEKTAQNAVKITAINPKVDYNHNRKDVADRLNKNAIIKSFDVMLASIFEFDNK